MNRSSTHNNPDWSINVHIAAWEKAEQEHRDNGEIELADFAQSRADQFKCSYVPRHLRGN